MKDVSRDTQGLAGQAEHQRAALKTMSTSDKIEEVLVALRRLIRATDLHSKKLVKLASVTGPQLLLLQILAAKDHLTISQLARDMSLSQATVTSILDRLQKRQLIERVRSSSDKRKVHPRLTERGRELLARAPQGLQDSFVNRFRTLDDWEQSMIIASLQRIAEMMDATQVDASPFLDVGELDRGISDLPKQP